MTSSFLAAVGLLCLCVAGTVFARSIWLCAEASGCRWQRRIAKAMIIIAALVLSALVLYAGAYVSIGQLP